VELTQTIIGLSGTEANGFNYSLKVSTLDLSGKVFIVTGGTSGIGEVVGRRLAKYEENLLYCVAFVSCSTALRRHFQFQNLSFFQNGAICAHLRRILFQIWSDNFCAEG
jgi:hypothetical protein